MVICVIYQAHKNVDLMPKAIGHVGKTFSGLLSSMQLVQGVNAADDGFTFVETDDPGNAMPLLVNEASPIPDDFAPRNLVRMREYCDSSVVTIKGSEIEGEKEAVDALMAMLRAAIDGGVKNWQISAGYRSVSYQKTLWDNKVYEYRQQGLSGADAQKATAKYVAVPGASEHHTGLAFDITVPGQSFPLTEQSKWLATNCWEFGFILRYTEEKQGITGINAEPWHIRYVGQPHARIMRDNDWCLEEYIEQMGQ